MRTLIACLLFPALWLAPLDFVLADKLCVRNRAQVNSQSRFRPTAIIKRVTGNCARGFTELVDTSSFTGPTGETGPAGADGNPFFYGDSSAAFSHTSGSLNLNDPTTGSEVLNFASFSISAGASVSIGSGATIRVAGPCDISGTLTVGVGADPGYINSSFVNGIVPGIQAPHPGAGRGVAGHGSLVDMNTQSAIALGGFSGRGVADILSDRRLSRLLIPLANFGGGGAASLASDASDGFGGGALRLLCEGALTIGSTGTISAVGQDGENGAGGGGGGLVVLASGTSIASAGTVTVAGGDGGAAASSVSNLATTGPGGGGSGGLIIFVSPTISLTGTNNLSAGSAGSTTAPGVIYDTRSGGGAGGAGAYGGGNGGSILADTTILAGVNGNDGEIFQLTGDPREIIVY